jgi:hypothetical protein
LDHMTDRYQCAHFALPFRSTSEDKHISLSPAHGFTGDHK